MVERVKIKLTKFREGRADSFPGPIDMVYYKDEKDVLYRLKYVKCREPAMDMAESLHRVMCVASYAPWIIEGEVAAEDDSGEVRVEMRGDVYVLQKNAEMIEFKDIRDIMEEFKKR